jgi:hypothetical protein
VEPTDYEFSAEYESKDGRRFILLRFEPCADVGVMHLRRVWRKMANALENFHELAGTPDAAPGWVKWKVDQWAEDHRLAGRQKFLAWCGPELVGLLNLWADQPSAADSARRLMYVEHMAAAPGHLQTPLWRRRFTRVGLALLAYAVFQSHRQGYDGRLGLHAADDAALGYYLDIHRRFGERLFLPAQEGIPGMPPRPDDARRKPYLELTEEGPSLLLERFRRG